MLLYLKKKKKKIVADVMGCQMKPSWTIQVETKFNDVSL